jgi:hypothetical protein
LENRYTVARVQILAKAPLYGALAFLFEDGGHSLPRRGSLWKKMWKSSAHSPKSSRFSLLPTLTTLW